VKLLPTRQARVGLPRDSVLAGQNNYSSLLNEIRNHPP
jgi:hypothetical protein